MEWEVEDNDVITAQAPKASHAARSKLHVVSVKIKIRVYSRANDGFVDDYHITWL